MKRLFLLILCLAFILALLVFPVSAVSSLPAAFDSFDLYYDSSAYPFYVFVDLPGILSALVVSDSPFYVDSSLCLCSPGAVVSMFVNYGNQWESFYLEKLTDLGEAVLDWSDPPLPHIFSNYTLYYEDGLIFHESDLIPSPGEDGSVGSIDADGLMSSIVGGLFAFSTSNLIIIIGAVLGITVAPVLLWFGFNFAKRKLMGTMRKGRL